jgi:hypothetical protein
MWINHHEAPPPWHGHGHTCTMTARSGPRETGFRAGDPGSSRTGGLAKEGTLGEGHRASPFLSPAWRWSRADRPLEPGERPRWEVDYVWVGRARCHLQRQAGQTDLAVEAALRVYEGIDPHRRWLMEACLLTPEPLEAVARRYDRTPDVVEAYHTLFSARRERPAALIHVVSALLQPARTTPKKSKVSRVRAAGRGRATKATGVGRTAGARMSSGPTPLGVSGSVVTAVVPTGLAPVYSSFAERRGGERHGAG